MEERVRRISKVVCVHLRVRTKVFAMMCLCVYLCVFVLCVCVYGCVCEYVFVCVCISIVIERKRGMKWGCFHPFTATGQLSTNKLEGSKTIFIIKTAAGLAQEGGGEEDDDEKNHFSHVSQQRWTNLWRGGG